MDKKRKTSTNHYESLKKYKAYFKNQKRIALACFAESPKTMKQVAEETGLDRSNLCRFIAEWEEEYQIVCVKIGICPISKHPKVKFYTTPNTLF